LILGIAFNYLLNNVILNKHNLVFIIGILSTFSTAGYITLFLLLIIIMITKRFKWYYFLVIPIALMLGNHFYYNLGFLNEKIEDQILLAQDDSNKGRFGSAITDIKDIKKFPLFGRGRNSNTRFDTVEKFGEIKKNHRTNGLTDFVVKNGVLFFIIFSVFLYKSLHAISLLNNVKTGTYYFILILVLTSSQGFFERPLFISLIFLFTTHGIKKLPPKLLFGKHTNGYV